MQIKKLNNIGVEILDIDITQLTDIEYKQIKDILTEELVVLIKHQEYKNPYYYALLVSKLGRIGNMTTATWKYKNRDITNPIPNTDLRDIQPDQWEGILEEFPVQRVTGKKKDNSSQHTGIFGSGTLTWHSNMNSPYNAAGVALQGISDVLETSTSFLDTTKVYEDMTDEFKQRCHGIIADFKYTPEIWAEGLPEDQHRAMIEGHLKIFKKLEYQMPLLNKNISGTKTGLFFHFNNGCSFKSDPALLNDLKGLCIQDKYIYQHWWEPGDIILMDQKLTLHKRDQDDPDILAKRVLHRYTFMFK